MTKAGWTYLRRLAVVMIIYGVLLSVAIIVVNRIDPGPLRYAAMLLVLPPQGGVVWAVVRLLREADEFQSRSLVESLAIGFAGGSLTCFSYGLLQVVGAPHLNWMFVWVGYALWWAIGTAIVRWHYS